MTSNQEPRLIELGISGEYAMVDYEDHRKCMQFDWTLNRGAHSKYKYAIARLDSNNLKVSTALSRFIYGKKHREHQLTYVNGNTLDCTKGNIVLRNRNLIKFNLLDVTDDDINEVKHKFIKSSRNASGYVGVFFNKKLGLWLAKHKGDKGDRSIGRFTTKEMAALAYFRFTQEKREIHGKQEGSERWWVAK